MAVYFLTHFGEVGSKVRCSFFGPGRIFFGKQVSNLAGKYSQPAERPLLGLCMRIPVGLFALAAVSALGLWWWLGAPVAMPVSPLAPGEKLYCVSYAPFRADQSPLDSSVRVEPWQIEEDLTRLAALPDSVR